MTPEGCAWSPKLHRAPQAIMAAASARMASGCLKPPNSPHEVWNLPLIARYCRPVFAKKRARSGNLS